MTQYRLKPAPGSIFNRHVSGWLWIALALLIGMVMWGGSFFFPNGFREFRDGCVYQLGKPVMVKLVKRDRVSGHVIRTDHVKLTCACRSDSDCRAGQGSRCKWFGEHRRCSIY
jgi:hypothetical protein